MAMSDLESTIEAARILYEGSHGMTMAELANRTGIAKRTLSMYARDQQWTKRLETKHGGSTEDAAKAAALFQQQSGQRSVDAAENNKAAQMLGEPLPREKDDLLERHRKEWMVPRAISVEAVKMRDTDPMRSFEKAKLSKITAETLKLIQDGERKAHGIDSGEAASGSIVVIERGAND